MAPPPNPHFSLDLKVEELVDKFAALDTRKRVTRLKCTNCSEKQLHSMKMRLLFGSDSDSDED